MNIFIVYDQNGNITQASNNYPQVTPPQQMLVCDNNTPNASNALSQPSNYMVQNGQIIPAVTVSVNRTHAMNGINDVWTLTITTSDNAAHTINMAVQGTNYTESLSVPVGGLTYTVELRNSIKDSQFMFVFSGTGIVTLDVPVGGSKTLATTVKVAKDTNGDLLIKGIVASDIKSYYATHTVANPDILSDMANTLDLLVDIVNILLPWAQASTYAPVTLTADQKNAVTTLANQYAAGTSPLTRLKLSDMAPATGSTTTQNQRWPQIVSNKQTANSVANNCLSELNDPDVH